MPDEVKPERACDRCRERRVKCDKRKPECYRCEKLGQSCPGYAKKRKFVDEGATLRRKFENVVESRLNLNTPTTSAYESRHDPSGSQSAHIPSSETMHGYDKMNVVTSMAGSKTQVPKAEGCEYTAPISTALPPAETIPISMDVFYDPVVPDRPVDAILGDYMDGMDFDPDWFDLDPFSFYSKAGNSCGFLPNAPSIIDGVDRSDDVMLAENIQSLLADRQDATLQDYWSYWASDGQLETSLLLSDQREHELAYLVRHFCENVGPWMDLFDAERHFAQLVPLKALQDVLLKNAVAAVAAKQLGCIKGNRAYLSPQSQSPAVMELITHEGDVDWFYKAANYYDKAIMYSRLYLQALSGSLSAPPSPAVSASLSVVDADDLLLAVSIFSLYEYLDNADDGWVQHLTGLKTILSVLTPSVQLLIPSEHVTLGRRASFWNFARADYQSAFINKTTTLLDTKELPMWLESGLQIKTGGVLYADAKALAQNRGALSSTNQLVARTLLWILLCIMNHLAVPQDVATMSKGWKYLNDMLNSWQATKPGSFQPCTRLRRPISRIDGISNNDTAKLSPTNINELFFSIPLCAATIQLYHFARILMLQHKLPTSDIFDSDNSIVNDRTEILAHAYAIIGIALGRPCPAVRVEMLLPLYLAGSCLKDDGERRVVLDLLLAIQKDTGFKAVDRMDDLTVSWGWSSNQGALA